MMIRFFSCGLLALAAAGCSVEPSVPPHQIVHNQRENADQIEKLRKKQMDEIDAPQPEPGAGSADAEATEEP
jgi:hypothetical protein